MKPLRDGHIGYNEAIALTVFFIAYKVFFIFPTVMAQKGVTAGWLVALIAAIITTLAWLVMARLMARFPNKSLVEVSEEIAGSLLGGIISLLFFCFFLAWTIFILRQFAEIMITAILPQTPISIITGVALVAGVYCCYQGVETMSRACFLISPFTAVALLALIMGVLPYAHFDYVFPLLGPGVPNLIKEGALATSFYGEILLLAILYPAIRQANTFNKIGLWSLGLSALLMVGVVGVFQMVFPFPMAQDVSYPMHQMARLIYIGRFVQRVESIFIFLLVFGALLKITIGIYASTVTLTRVLQLPVYRPLLFPLVILIFALTLTIPDYPTTLRLAGETIINYGWSVALVLPMMLLAVAMLRGKGVTHHAPASKK